MKKILALLLTAMMIGSLTACASEPEYPLRDNSALFDQSSEISSDTVLDTSSEQEVSSKEEITSSDAVSDEDAISSDITETKEPVPPTLYAPDPTSAVYERVMTESLKKLRAYNGSQQDFSITLENPFGLPDAEVRSFFHDLIQHAAREDGELYWMLPGFSTTTYNSQTREVTYKPYIYEQFTGANFAKSQTLFYAALDEVTAEIFRPGMSDTEKVLSAYGWLCANTVYEKAQSYASYNAYSALVDKTSICNGYMVTMNLLMKKAGIACYMVASRTETDNTWHVWNVVQLGGVWYALDATQGYVYGHTSYHHFLVNDSAMLSDGNHLESITRLGIQCKQSYPHETPWFTTSMPFTYSEKYGALVNVENYVIQDGVTLITYPAKYRKVKIDQNGNVTAETIAEIPQHITSCTREYNGELLFITYNGDLMTYHLDDGDCYKISETNHKGQYVYIEGSLLVVSDGDGNVTARYQLAEEVR